MGTYKIGFVGCGNMGKAMAKGMISAGLMSDNDIIASVGSEDEANSLREEVTFTVVTDNRDAVRNSDTVIIAVKPNVLTVVLPEVREEITEDTLVISIAAGQSIESIESQLSEVPEGATITNIRDAVKKKVKLIRVMPNVNAMVGQAMSALTANENVTDADKEYAKKLFDCFGKAEFLPEKLMDVVTGLSGSGPAFVYMFIEALADGAVAEGMPRKQAYTFAAQTVLGSAEMMLKSGKHPGELKDMVCSPGGTTIEGVAALEMNGFRNAAIEAVRVATDKSRGL